MGTPCRDHCHDTVILVLSVVASAFSITGAGMSVEWHNHGAVAVPIESHTYSLLPPTRTRAALPLSVGRISFNFFPVTCTTTVMKWFLPHWRPV